MTPGTLQAAERLADILARENAALNRLDFPAAVALLAGKEAALAEMAQMPEPVRTPALVALAQRMRVLAEENRVLLERAIGVQTRIVQIVARAVTPAPQGARYSRPDGWMKPQRAAALALSTHV
jgi:hypothetical protein